MKCIGLQFSCSYLFGLVTFTKILLIVIIILWFILDIFLCLEVYTYTHTFLGSIYNLIRGHHSKWFYPLYSTIVESWTFDVILDDNIHSHKTCLIYTQKESVKLMLRAKSSFLNHFFFTSSLFHLRCHQLFPTCSPVLSHLVVSRFYHWLRARLLTEVQPTREWLNKDDARILVLGKEKYF